MIPADIDLVRLVADHLDTTSPSAAAARMRWVEEVCNSSYALPTGARGPLILPLSLSNGSLSRPAPSLEAISGATHVAGSDRTNVGEELVAHNPTVEALRSFKAYRRGWDGYGAEAPAPASIDAAIAFVDRLPARFGRVVPMVHAAGFAMLEIRRDGFYANFEFDPAGTVAWFIESGDVVRDGIEPFDGRTVPMGVRAALDEVAALA